MEFETEESELSVRDFYNKYRKQLPKIVMVNQGFYDDTGSDTFSREQVIRLHKTVKRKRVLVESYVRRVKKTYSMSINYPEKLCVEDQLGNVLYDKTLLEIVRDHTLPVRVRLARDRTILVNGQHVRTNSFPDMDLIQTFDEISFLGNDIEKGVMSPEVMKIPLSIEKLMFTIVTGIAGQSARRWQEFTTMKTTESKSLDYSKEPGLEDIAQYSEDQVTAGTRFDRLEPVNYTNLSILLPNKNTWSRSAPKPTASPNDDDTYELFENVSSNKPRGVSFLKDITTALATRGKGIKKAVTASSTGEAPRIKSDPFRGDVTKPNTAPKPFPKPSVKSGKTTNPFKQDEEGKYVNSRLHVGQDTVPLVNTKKPTTLDTTLPLSDEPVVTWKVYDPELDYDIAVTDTGRHMSRSYCQGRVGEYFEQDNVVEYFDQNEDSVTNQPAAIYTNTSQMAIITPMSPKDDNVYVNANEINRSGTQRVQILPSERTRRQVSKVEVTDRRRTKLSKADISNLSVDEVGEYLRLLNIDAVAAFRSEMVDGKMLQQIGTELLEQEFKLKPLEIMRLQNFVKEGHIPQ